MVIGRIKICGLGRDEGQYQTGRGGFNLDIVNRISMLFFDQFTK